MLTADGSQSYEFVVTAEVTSISSNQGGTSGNRLNIAGNGFGTATDDVSVDISGLNCSIVSITNTEIVCDV